MGNRMGRAWVMNGYGMGYLHELAKDKVGIGYYYPSLA
jgi:hypothetical protein